MTKLSAVQFSPKHLEVMEIRSVEADGPLMLKDSYDRIDRVAKNSVQALTFLYDGRILFCGGFNELWPGVFELWMIPSVYIRKFPILFSRIAKRYVERIVKDFKCIRIQTTSLEDPFHCRWMEFLRFTKEGVLHKYMNGLDYGVYARTF